MRTLWVYQGRLWVVFDSTSKRMFDKWMKWMDHLVDGQMREWLSVHLDR